METTKQFERKDIISDSELDYGFELGYNECLDKTNAKELWIENQELKNQLSWLKKFVWEDSVNLKFELHKTVPPFRVGKKQKRAILDSNGHEVGIFVTGKEAVAQIFCDFLNANYTLINQALDKANK